MKGPKSGGDGGTLPSLVLLRPGLGHFGLFRLLGLPQGINPKDEQEKMDKEEKQKGATPDQGDQLRGWPGGLLGAQCQLRVKFRWEGSPHWAQQPASCLTAI